MLAWVRKALKENHQYEIDARTKEITSLQEKEKKLLKRLNDAYEDKLDGKITEDFWHRKTSDWQVEEQQIGPVGLEDMGRGPRPHQVSPGRVALLEVREFRAICLSFRIRSLPTDHRDVVVETVVTDSVVVR